HLQLDHALPGAGQLGTFVDSALRPDVLELRLGLERAAPPRCDLGTEVLEELLELGHRPKIRTLVTVRHVSLPWVHAARPPAAGRRAPARAPPAPAAPIRPLRCRAVFDREPGR